MVRQQFGMSGMAGVDARPSRGSGPGDLVVQAEGRERPAGADGKLASEACSRRALVPDSGVLAASQEAAIEASAKARDVLDQARDILRELDEGSPSGKGQAPVWHVSPEVSRSLDDVLRVLARRRGEIDAAADALRRSRPTPIRVALFGKTKAGKTTLRDALTGGDGRGIGRGRQRSTRVAEDAAWGDFILTDTPGTAALGGGEDTLRALTAAAHADVVIYLADDDALREEEIKAAIRLRAIGVPLVVAMNVKFDLTDPLNRDRFLRNPAVAFRPSDMQGHQRRLDSLSERLGLPSPGLVPIHAQAAFMANLCEDAGVAGPLRAASRVEDLVAAISTFLSTGRAPLLRMRTALDRATAPVRAAAAELGSSADTMQGLAAQLAELSERLRRGLEPEIDGIRREAAELPRQWLRQVRAEVAPFVDANIEKPNVSGLWKKLFDGFGLPQRAEAWRDAASKRVLSEASEIELDLAWESSGPSLNAGTIQRDSPTDWKGAARYGGAGLGLVAGIMLLAGAATGGAAFVAVSAGGVVLTLVGSFLEPRAERLRRAKDQAASKLMVRLDDIQTSLEVQMTSWVRDNLEGGVERARARLDGASGQIADLAQTAQRASRELWGVVENADRWLLSQAVVRLGERGFPPPLRVARSPGVVWKLLVNRPLTDDVRRSASLALGEPLHEVMSGDPINMIARSLSPAEVPPAAVKIVDGSGVAVALAREAARVARGAGDANLSAASRLLDVRIDVQEIEEGSDAG